MGRQPSVRRRTVAEVPGPGSRVTVRPIREVDVLPRDGRGRREEVGAKRRGREPALGRRGAAVVFRSDAPFVGRRDFEGGQEGIRRPIPLSGDTAHFADRTEVDLVIERPFDDAHSSVGGSQTFGSFGAGAMSCGSAGRSSISPR